MTPTMLPRHRDELLALGTSTVYEAAAGAARALDPSIRPAWPGARLCGPAYTVACEPGDNLAIHRSLEHAPPGSVLVVQAGGVLAGYWGEVLCCAAQERGILGLVIDGGLRDVDALERLEFPAFSRGISMLGTAKRDAGTIGEPIVLAGTEIDAGSVILGDRDGVLVLLATQLSTLRVAARKRQDEERKIIDRIRSGEQTLDIYHWRRLVPPDTA